jgi:hypothetical protein
VTAGSERAQRGESGMVVAVGWMSGVCCAGWLAGRLPGNRAIRSAGWPMAAFKIPPSSNTACFAHGREAEWSGTSGRAFVSSR